LITGIKRGIWGLVMPTSSSRKLFFKDIKNPGLMGRPLIPTAMAVDVGRNVSFNLTEEDKEILRPCYSQTAFSLLFMRMQEGVSNFLQRKGDTPPLRLKLEPEKEERIVSKNKNGTFCFTHTLSNITLKRHLGDDGGMNERWETYEIPGTITIETHCDPGTGKYTIQHIEVSGPHQDFLYSFLRDAQDPNHQLRTFEKSYYFDLLQSHFQNEGIGKNSTGKKSILTALENFKDGKINDKELIQELQDIGKDRTGFFTSLYARSHLIGEGRDPKMNIAYENLKNLQSLSELETLFDKPSPQSSVSPS